MQHTTSEEGTIVVQREMLSRTALDWLTSTTEAEGKVIEAIEAAARPEIRTASGFIAINAFIETCVVADPSARLGTTALVDAAEAYLRRRALPWPGDTRARQWLRSSVMQRFEVRECHDVPGPNGRVRGFNGVRFKKR